MSGKVKFWIAVAQESQLDFEGREHIKEVPVGYVHIVYPEILMRRQSRERIKADLKAKKHRVLSVRPVGKMCPKCEKNFREHPDLEFQIWTRSVETTRLSEQK